jgi:histone H3/H4
LPWINHSEVPEAEISNCVSGMQITKLNITLKRKRSCGEVNMTKSQISVAPMHRLCKKAGAERVSEAAAKELAKALEEIGVKIAKEALDYAIHSRRKTVKSEDIEIATRKVMGK